MSCSVKISSGKSWSGSQRRIVSLPEEAAHSGQQPPSSGSNLPNQPTSAGTTSHNSHPHYHQSISSPHPGPRSAKSIATKRGEDTTKLLKYIDDNVVGKNGTFFGPFGRRKVVYCDYSASGRSLQFLEEYITREVLPCLGDTKASTTICSLQSSLFRHEARDIVRHAVGAGEQDAVLFTGHGTDDALRTLLRHLDLPRRPMVVFVGPFEHHANLRPWREHGTKVVRIAETRDGFLDLNDLDRKLVEERSVDGVMQPLLVGCFSAASCITGVLADDVATTLLLHQHGALSVWDYTSAAPFVQMDMNPHLPGVGETAVHKDAIIFSGHKFMGGAQSPGVLVAKKALLRDDIGSEDIRDSHRYLRDPELREESGSAGVVESIRCGLAVQLKENVTTQSIIARQDKICRQVFAHVRTIPELILLGNTSQSIKRLPVFSFMVRHPRGTFLHHNFVCAILNDVFGVQARGGCACAGRYAHDLMGIDEELAKSYEQVLLQSKEDISRGDSETESLRPGFASLSLPYFMSETELAFVLEALKMVATEGWKLLPQYVLNPDTGEWRHHTNSVFKERKWLGSIRYTDGKMITSERRISGAGGIFPQSYADCLQTARNIFNRARKMAHRYPLQIDRSASFKEKSEELRWFILPAEAQDLLLGNSQNVKQDLPFDPMLRKRKLRKIEAVTSSPTSHGNANQAIRRLNSDIPRTGTTPVTLPSSPRHHSLPALSISPTSVPSSATRAAKRFEEKNDAPPIVLEGIAKDEQDGRESAGSRDNAIHGSPLSVASAASSRSESPMPPVKFALGEAVTSAMILGTTPAGARLMAGEHSMGSMSSGGDGARFGRARCNSLGSSTTGKSPAVPIPLSPQTLASLGIANCAGNSLRRGNRNCNCNSHADLSSSLEYDMTTESLTRSSPLSSNTSSPTSSSSPSPHLYSYTPLNTHNHHHHHHNVKKHNYHNHHHHHHDASVNVHYDAGETSPRYTTPRLGRCSPVLPQMSQSTEDDLRAYLKEVTKELATEIKSEIREVISKVDDVLSESNSSEMSTPQHHPQRTSSTSNERPEDSFSASEIAEYLMEFSKEMASEVKSEIRCMVNAVDGLGRFSPDLASASANSDKHFNSHGTPERRGSGALPSPPLVLQHKPAKSGKLSELLLAQQDSKMSSECSSDETVIYVVGPRATTNVVHDRAKTSDEGEGDDDEEEDRSHKSPSTTEATKISGIKTKLPEIYSAVNSVSSQDSGINLSFHESDIRSISDLGRSGSSSSSSGSSSAESYGNSSYCRKSKTAFGLPNGRRGRDEKLPHDQSEDEMREEPVVSSDDEDEAVQKIAKKEHDVVVDNEATCGPQWHSPPKNVWKATVEAIHEFDMIRDKDRILVCLPASVMGVGLAAGKFSLALLHTLHQYRFYARSKGIDFDIGAVTIDAGSSYDPMESMSYLKALQVPYFYEEAEEQTALIEPSAIAALETVAEATSDFTGRSCNVCGRDGINTRKQLYAVAKRYGYNVLALGQHLDDLAEGFLASLFYTGKLKTMKAHYYVREYDLRVTRPFVYVRERALRQFIEEKRLPVLRVACAACEKIVAQKSQKNREMMSQQERAYPRLYSSLRMALKPLILARGATGNAAGHQQAPRQKHKLKSRLSPSCPTVPLIATSQELDDSQTDEEPII
ncbi:uncharacterized protein [Venturia canescens]|uniref:uncharacterized protein n=1 Tax=Venturia canescens TaxID=32260 RepID=UPI001C9D4A52|nr:uncharacterized protein LOC122405635 [Venturia canescens]